MTEGELGEETSGFETGAVVIDADVGGARMRDVYGDEGDAGLGDLVGDDGCDVFVDLELDDDIDAFTDEGLGVFDGGLGVVVVVEYDEVYADDGGGRAEAGGHGLREWHVDTLAAEAEAQFARTSDVAILAVSSLPPRSRDGPTF